MRGNSQVRFLGGGGTAMRCCYPSSAPADRLIKKPAYIAGFFMGVYHPVCINQSVIEYQRSR